MGCLTAGSIIVAFTLMMVAMPRKTLISMATMPMEMEPIRYTDLVGISTVHNIVVEIGDFVQVNRTILWVRTVQDS